VFGLRVSEILGLQWGDFSFENRSVLVQRSVVGGRVDDVKTEYSKTMFRSMLVWPSAVELARCSFSREIPIGFLPIRYGKTVPPGELAEKAAPAGCEAGRVGRGHWVAHIRHTYRSWLDETGAPMKVQQELMRHASIQTTMNVYGRAMTETKRRANSQVVGLVFAKLAAFT